MDLIGTGWQVTSVLANGNHLLVRLFNAEGDAKAKEVTVGGKADTIELVDLDGRISKSLLPKRNQSNTALTPDMPRFGLRTIRLKNFKAN